MKVSFVPQSVEFMGLAPSSEGAMLKLIELAGRTAYKSEDKITEDSAKKFVLMLRDRRHLSVLEHSNICLVLPTGISNLDNVLYGELRERAAYFRIDPYGNRIIVSANARAWIEALPKCRNLDYFFARSLKEFYPGLFNNLSLKYAAIKWLCELFTEERQIETLKANEETDLPVFVFKIVTDRGITHEIVRHRVFSFTQESTRYVNYGNKGCAFIQPTEYSLDEAQAMYKATAQVYASMLENDLSPQIARDMLPNLLKAEIIVSGRWSGWKHFIALREAKGAHPRIREIAAEVRRVFDGMGLVA